MENGPQLPHEQLAWQDITVEVVHEMIAENKLTEARQAAALRLQALLEACLDIDAAVQENNGEISREEWVIYKKDLQEEIKELELIIVSIDTETLNE
jgi:uncharacterized coiled-coil protein SlyX